MDWMTNQTKTKKMSHHFLDHKNLQKNNEESIDPILLALEANGATRHWRRLWMQLKEGQFH